ncbi:MAG TPA: sugar phosphate nucleotidyltransferase [Ignavibacteria bacterium]|mgnify:CR=1 FL=1|nr:sugar phosphate nucleotidyltransferase [Ignavibacteria bacterium]
MEKFLGVLFCGGKGTRLGEITEYISKSFIPIYDKPVFKFGLELLENSKKVDEIVILTNEDNDAKLRKTGHRTIVQEDSRVTDMISGWDFVKKYMRSKKHGVLVPSDNICEVKIDNLIKEFEKKTAEFLFSVREIEDRNKLSQMGCYDIETKKYYYKHSDPPTDYGVIAPYIIENKPHNISGINIFEKGHIEILFQKGYWFDIGDCDSIIEASNWRKKTLGKN